MAEKSVFEQIKKQNGERFAKAIRGYDNGIFDIPGIVDIVKYAGREAEPIMKYLESLKKIQIEETGAYQDPITLLDAAGYDAYYVTNLEEQNAIQKYYAKGEELCTFRDPVRFKNYHIINAVRKDVDQIKRADFIGKEEREDEYGTSVISIQILKSGGFISIKNRYNHTIENPDNTFGSNPDRIIPGLSNSLRHHFNTDFSAKEAQLPSNFTFINNQIIRYQSERDNIYFGSNFYVEDGVVHRLQSHEMMLDSYILDLRTKTLTNPRDPERYYGETEEDKSFKNVFLKETEGYDIIIKKEDDGQHLFLHKPKDKDGTQQPDIDFLTVKDGAITALNLPTTTEIGYSFLQNNKELRSLTAPHLTSMGSSCFLASRSLKSLNLPVLKSMGDSCFHNSEQLETLNLPSLTHMSNYCFDVARELTSLNLPALISMGEFCFNAAGRLKTLNAPALKRMGVGCFNQANLTSLNLPSLTKMEGGCFQGGSPLKTISLPALTEMGQGCFMTTTTLKTFYAPLLEKSPRLLFSQLNPIKRTILWLKRKQKPEVAKTGISAALQQAETADQAQKSGISERLTRENQAQNSPTTPQQTQDTSFFNKLKKWLLPQK